MFDDGRRDLPGCPEGCYRGDLDRLSAGLTVSPSLQIPSHHPCQTTLSTLPLCHKQTHTHTHSQMADITLMYIKALTAVHLDCQGAFQTEQLKGSLPIMFSVVMPHRLSALIARLNFNLKP